MSKQSMTMRWLKSAQSHCVSNEEVNDDSGLPFADSSSLFSEDFSRSWATNDDRWVRLGTC